MTALPDFETVQDAFVFCRDMDGSLQERLDAFADAARKLRPESQEAVDRLVARLAQYSAGWTAPQVGEPLPPFILPAETGQLVTLEQLLATGPIAVVFHRGHWCPYCRINTKSLAEVQDQAMRDGARIVAIMPDRQLFAAAFKSEASSHFPVLTDTDNGYALSLNIAFWVGDELQRVMESGGRDLPRYQGNEMWMLPIPATFIVDQDGFITERFIDPDYRRRMPVENLLAALRSARRGAD